MNKSFSNYLRQISVLYATAITYLPDKKAALEKNAKLFTQTANALDKYSEDISEMDASDIMEIEGVNKSLVGDIVAFNENAEESTNIQKIRAIFYDNLEAKLPWNQPLLSAFVELYKDATTAKDAYLYTSIAGSLSRATFPASIGNLERWYKFDQADEASALLLEAMLEAEYPKSEVIKVLNTVENGEATAEELEPTGTIKLTDIPYVTEGEELSDFVNSYFMLNYNDAYNEVFQALLPKEEKPKFKSTSAPPSVKSRKVTKEEVIEYLLNMTSYHLREKNTTKAKAYSTLAKRWTNYASNVVSFKDATQSEYRKNPLVPHEFTKELSRLYNGAVDEDIADELKEGERFRKKLTPAQLRQYFPEAAQKPSGESEINTTRLSKQTRTIIKRNKLTSVNDALTNPEISEHDKLIIFYGEVLDKQLPKNALNGVESKINLVDPDAIVKTDKSKIIVTSDEVENLLNVLSFFILDRNEADDSIEAIFKYDPIARPVRVVFKL